MCRHPPFAVDHPHEWPLHGQWQLPDEQTWPTDDMPDAFAVPRTVLEAVGGLDEERFPFHYDEADLGARIRALGFRGVVVRDARVRHYSRVKLSIGDIMVRAIVLNDPDRARFLAGIGSAFTRSTIEASSDGRPRSVHSRVDAATSVACLACGRRLEDPHGGGEGVVAGTVDGYREVCHTAVSSDGPHDPSYTMRLAVGSLTFPTLDEICSFGTDRRWTGRPVVLALLIDRLEPERLLDVGCKGGWLIDHCKAPFKLGVDTDDVPGMGARADACRLPFRSASFDVVTLLDVIEHLPRGMERRRFPEASRVLEPNGHLVVSTPADWRIGTVTDPLWMLYGHRHYKMARR